MAWRSPYECPHRSRSAPRVRAPPAESRPVVRRPNGDRGGHVRGIGQFQVVSQKVLERNELRIVEKSTLIIEFDYKEIGLAVRAWRQAAAKVDFLMRSTLARFPLEQIPDRILIRAALVVELTKLLERLVV